MARLPNPADMRRRQVSGQSAVARTDTSNADYGASDLAGAFGRIVDRDTDYQIAEARTQFLARKAEQDNAYDQDDDPATIAQRYETEMREAAQAAGANISLPRSRELFLKSIEPDLERGKQNMESLAFAKHKDERRNHTNEQLNSLKDTALNGSNADMMSAYQTVQQMMNGGAEAGFYSQEEAGNIARAWRGEVSVERIQGMDPADALVALEQPWAQGIPSGTRNRIKKQAEQDLRENKAMRRADEIHTAHSGDYQEMLAEARTIEDADERRAVEDRINELRIQDDNAEKDAQGKAYEQGLQTIVDGGRYRDIPASVVDRMDARSAYNLQEIDRRRQADRLAASTLSAADKAELKLISQINEDYIGGVRAENPEMWLSGPENWDGELRNAYENMSATAQQDLIKQISEARVNGIQADVVDDLFNQALPMIEFYAPEAAKAYTIDFTDPEDSKMSRGVRAELMKRIREHSRKKGGAEPTSKELKDMVGRAFAAYDPDEYPYLDYEAVLGGAMRLPNARRGAEAYRIARERLGRVPSETEVQQIYDQLGGD